MDYAVIKTGGKQFIVRPNDLISVDNLNVEKGKITFDQVLLLSNEGKLEIGSPLVNAKINAEIVENYQGEKVRVARFKAKSNYRRVKGFRKQLTKVKILGLTKKD